MKLKLEWNFTSRKNKDASRDEEEPDGKSVQESNQKTPANFYKEEREAPSTSQIKTDEHKYDLSHKKLGTAFVFVNEVFDSPNFMDRLGAKDDLRYYNEAFTHLGFKVKEYLDKTAEQIEKDISTCKYWQTYKYYNSCFLNALILNLKWRFSSNFP